MKRKILAILHRLCKPALRYSKVECSNFTVLYALVMLCFVQLIFSFMNTIKKIDLCLSLFVQYSAVYLFPQKGECYEAKMWYLQKGFRNI